VAALNFGNGLVPAASDPTTILLIFSSLRLCLSHSIIGNFYPYGQSYFFINIKYKYYTYYVNL